MTEKNYKRYNKEFKEEAVGIFGVRVKLNYEVRTLLATPVFITKKSTG